MLQFELSRRFLNNRTLHFVGLGGIGVSALAELCMGLGARVQGSDIKANARVRHLEQKGARFFKGHSATHIKGAHLLIHTMAVGGSNVELQAAHQLGVPVVARPLAVQNIVNSRASLCVTGAHGKTTTTALLGHMLLACGQDPSMLLGGVLQSTHSPALLGGEQGPFVCEVDESDGSLVNLHPEWSIITNIDTDHLDHYQNLDAIKKSFRAFGSQTKKTLLACGDDRVLLAALKGLNNVELYGFGAHNKWRLEKTNIYCGTQFCTELTMPLPGAHNALNVLAAYAMCCELNLHASNDLPKALEDFKGVRRRFDFVGKAPSGALLFDDYAHHPTAISCLLKAVREKFPKNRLVVLFQPHKYSRTKHCFKEFVSCFDACDVLFISNTYPSGESRRCGVSSRVLADSIKKCQHVGDLASAQKAVLEIIKKEDVFFSIGAGDVVEVAHKIRVLGG